MIKRTLLHSYILSKFISILIMAIVAFLVIFHVVDLIEKIDKYIKADMSIIDVCVYYFYQLPYYIDMALPMSMLLASVFTIGSLAKHNELSAIKASGISLYRVCLPILIFGLFVSIGSFFFEDIVLIPSSREKIAIEKDKLKKHRSSRKKIIYNVTYQDSPDRNMVFAKYYKQNNRALTVTVQETKENRLHRRIDAKKMIWEPEELKWKLYNFKIRSFDDEGNEQTSEIISDSLFSFNLTPDDLNQTNIKPEELRFFELKNFISRLNTSGNDPQKWEVNLHYKIAFPFTNFIVILFGLSLTAMKNRNSTGFGAGVSFLIIFTYYLFIKFGQVLGFKGIVSPFLGAWLGNIFFLLGGAFLFYRIKQ